MDDLADSASRALSGVIGARLRCVTLRTLPFEVSDESELADPLLYIGGELRLEFELQSVFVSWAENDGWGDHFSIAVRCASHFRADALCDLDVSELATWRERVGQPLVAARVFAIDGTPHLVALSFGGRWCWMADGSEERVGDGDDLLIRTGPVPDFDGAALLWSI